MRRFLRWTGISAVLLVVLLAGLHLATMAPAPHVPGHDVTAHEAPGHDVPVLASDVPLPDGGGTRLWAVDHGYHSGVILTQSDLRRAAVEIGRVDVAAGMRLRWLASRWPDADWIEIGWGDAAFYQQTPGIGDVDVLLGLRALLWPTEAVLQVVPGWGAPEIAFRGSDLMPLDVADAALPGLALRLARTIPEPVPARWLGPSLYGQGAFYPARLDYHLFRTCNHWVAWVLRGAGLPASPVPGTFSAGLMAELRFRLNRGI